MDDRELPYVKEYHQRLIDVSCIESQTKNSRPPRPSWSDYFLLRLGDSLIATGQRIKNGSFQAESNQRADLSQEGA